MSFSTQYVIDDANGLTLAYQNIDILFLKCIYFQFYKKKHLK